MTKIETFLGENILWDEFEELSESQKNFRLAFFIYESNLIEGININPIETMDEGEVPHSIPELDGHHAALDYVIENYSIRSPGQRDIKEMHRLLMSDIWERDIAYTVKKKKLSKSTENELRKKYMGGEYRNCKIWIGKHGGVYYRQVPRLMKSLERKIEHIDGPTPENIWDMHHEFETIHPFIDGNGRTGRLLLNWLSLRHLGYFEVIEAKHRGDYYAIIQGYTAKFKKENPNIGFYKDRD